MFRFLALLLILLPWSVRAEDIDAQLRRILSTESSHLHAVEISSGPLDGTHDIYHLALVEDVGGALVVYFMREAESGAVEVRDRVEVGSAAARAIWGLKIKRKSVFISVHSSGGCCSHGGSAYQLKLNGDKHLAIIGYEEMDHGTNDGELFYENGLSLNVINGDAIKSFASSKKVEMLNEADNPKPSWRMFKLLPPVTKKARGFRVRIDRQWTLGDVGGYDEAFHMWLLSNVHGFKE